MLLAPFMLTHTPSVTPVRVSLFPKEVVSWPLPVWLVRRRLSQSSHLHKSAVEVVLHQVVMLGKFRNLLLVNGLFPPRDSALTTKDKMHLFFDMNCPPPQGRHSPPHELSPFFPLLEKGCSPCLDLIFRLGGRSAYGPQVVRMHAPHGCVAPLSLAHRRTNSSHGFSPWRADWTQQGHPSPMRLRGVLWFAAIDVVRQGAVTPAPDQTVLLSFPRPGFGSGLHRWGGLARNDQYCPPSGGGAGLFGLFFMTF